MDVDIRQSTVMVDEDCSDLVPFLCECSFHLPKKAWCGGLELVHRNAVSRSVDWCWSNIRCLMLGPPGMFGHFPINTPGTLWDGTFGELGWDVSIHNHYLKFIKGSMSQLNMPSEQFELIIAYRSFRITLKVIFICRYLFVFEVNDLRFIPNCRYRTFIDIHV